MLSSCFILFVITAGESCMLGIFQLPFIIIFLLLFYDTLILPDISLSLSME